MNCEHESHEWYPQYGVGPHTHDLHGGTFIGSTVLLQKVSWPANYHEDPDTPGRGTWECPGCGPKTCHHCGTSWFAPVLHCPKCTEKVSDE